MEPGTEPLQPPADAPAGPTEPAGAPAVARQRWRLVLARSVDAPPYTARELAERWEAVLDGSVLPFHRPPGRARGRIAFGAPLPLAMAAERELADIVLDQVWPVWRVRDSLDGRLPDGWLLVDLYDVWLGEPALAGQVAAADYRIEVTGATAANLTTAATEMLAATRLPRERQKGSGVVAYDLRPLVASVVVVEVGPPVVLRARTRFDSVLGTGRPEEVVAALGDLIGAAVSIGSIVRERLLLASELG